MFSNSKGLMLERLKQFLNLSQEEVMCVGDGAITWRCLSIVALKSLFVLRKF